MGCAVCKCGVAGVKFVKGEWWNCNVMWSGCSLAVVEVEIVKGGQAQVKGSLEILEYLLKTSIVNGYINQRRISE